MQTLVRKAALAARNPRYTREQLEIYRDYVRFKRRNEDILRSVTAPPDAPKALIVSLTENVHQLKLEGVLAKGLQLEGRRPVALTMERARWSSRYFRAFGVDDFVTPEQYMRPDHLRLVEEEARAFLDGGITAQDLKAYRYRDANVGIQVLSSISRVLQQGRVKLDDEIVRTELAQRLPSAMATVHAAEELLDDLEPEIVLFLEKSYAGFGSIYDVALDRGLNVIQYAASGIHWRDALLVKRYTEETRRMHPASLADDTWARVREMPWTEEREAELRHEFEIRYGDAEKHPDAGLQEGKHRKPADEVRAQLGLRPGRKVAVVFSHVLWDANMFYGDDLFEDQETWLVETVRAACANDRLDWIVKLHPANLYKAETPELNDEVALREALGALPAHVKLMRPETDVNTYSLFELADYAITIRGTVGIETPCFGIPTLTAGTGRYSGKGFTIDSDTAEDYLALLGRLQEVPPLGREETELAKRYAYALFRLRPLHFTSFESHFEPYARLGNPLGQNLELTLRSEAELRSAPDLRAFGGWALDRSRLDWLNEL
jgi:hypothetical protein